jgi:hypothetical protein
MSQSTVETHYTHKQHHKETGEHTWREPDGKGSFAPVQHPHLFHTWSATHKKASLRALALLLVD